MAARSRSRPTGQGRALPDQLPEYLESTFGILKAGLVPVNTNYRYGDEELSTSGTTRTRPCVIFHGSFSERVDRLRWPAARRSAAGSGSTTDRVRVRTGPSPTRRRPASATARTRAPWGRSGDDLYLLYTGGTTGVPKGVMWRQDDLFSRLNAGNLIRLPEDEGLDGVRKTVQGPGPVHLPACPLMHGTGAFSSMGMLAVGGSVVTLESTKFDAAELLDTIDRQKVNMHRDRRRRFRQADPATPSTPSRAAGTSRPCSASSLRGSCGARRPNVDCCGTSRH